MLRSVAVFVGCLIVAATAHVSIVFSGGYAAPTAPLQIAIALGLCTGSVCIGAALSDGRWILAFVFVIALLSGETYAILTSSEITLSARDTAAAPLQDLAKKRKAAAEELAAAEAASPAPADRSRLNVAEKGQVAAETAVREKAADKSCRENCRLLLQSAVDAAQREVEAARAEIDEKTRTASQRLEDRRTAAKTAVATLPPERSATPLADRLRVPEWMLDLLIAALRSIAGNGLGAALIAFGAHRNSTAVARRAAGHRTAVSGNEETREPKPSSARKYSRVAATPKLAAPTARDHAIRFSREMLTPAESDTPVSALHPAYVAWCGSNGQMPFPLRQIAQEFAELFKRAGIEVIDVAGTKFVARARLTGVAKS